MRNRARATVIWGLWAAGLLAGCAPAQRAGNDPDPGGTGGAPTGGGRGGAGAGGTGAGVAPGGTGGASATGGGAAGGTGGGMSGGAGGGAGTDARSGGPADTAGNGGAGGASTADAAAPRADGPSADAPSVTPVPDAAMSGSNPLTAGWTEKAFTYAIHKPYDLAESDRHTFDAATNTHTFFTLRGDKPHQPPPNTTGARCELRMNNDYTSGNHQFEADVYVVSGTNGACVMQVFGGVTNATSIMLVAHTDNGGTVFRYDGPAVIKAMAYDRWWHLNVIHEANASGIGKIRVYADGQLMGTFDDRGNATHYFKCGVYNNSGARAESRFRNIKYWVK